MARRKRKKKLRVPWKKNVQTSLQDALMLMRQGNLDASAKIVAQVLNIADKPLEKEQAWRILTELQFRAIVKSHNPQEKLTLVDSALKTAPQDMRLHFQRGIALLQTAKAAGAGKEFDLVAKNEPDREGLAFFRQLARLADKKLLGKERQLAPEETNTLALLELLQRRPSQKVAETIPAKPLLGDDPRLWGTLLKMRHAKDFARPEFFQEPGKMSKQPKVSAILQYYHGLAAMREQQPEIAHPLWQSALSHGFSTKWSQKNLGLALRQEFLDLAETQHWNEIINKSRHLPSTLKDDTLNQIVSQALFHLGYAEAQKEKWTQAVTHWKEASQKANNRYLAQNMALAQEKLGHWEQAAQSWKDMLRRKPRKPDHPDYLTDKQVSSVWEHISDCYYNAYEDDAAIDSLRKAIQYAPDNPAPRFKLIAALDPEDYKEQEAIIRELNGILDIDPDNINALTQLAHYYNDDWRHDAIPLWKRIVALEPDNKEARDELAQSFIDKALPHQKQKWPWGKPVSYKQQLAILQEGLDMLPDHPDLILSLAIAHMDAKKKKLAKEQFLRAYEVAPKDFHIASMVLQNLIHLKDKALIEELIPKIQTNPELLPAFWVDQAVTALDHPDWPERFFEAALKQVNFTEHATKASILVDIYISVPPEPEHQKLKSIYLRRIEQEVPKSGALEYIQAFLAFTQSRDVSKARRLLRKAKKLASAENDSGLLGLIERMDQMLATAPPKAMLDMLFGKKGMKGMEGMEGMLEDLLDELEGMGSFGKKGKKGKKGKRGMLEDLLDELEGFEDGPFF